MFNNQTPKLIHNNNLTSYSSNNSNKLECQLIIVIIGRRVWGNLTANKTVKQDSIIKIIIVVTIPMDRDNNKQEYKIWKWVAEEARAIINKLLN